MKKNKLWILLTVSILQFVACNAQSTQKIEHIKAKELTAVVNNPSIRLLDVRTPEEFETSHVKNAKNINILSDDFSSLVAELYPNKQDTIYVYCQSGKRSLKAVNKMEEMGYTHLINVEGGVEAIDAGILE